MPRPCSLLCTRVSPLLGARLNLTLLTPQVSGSLLLFDLESLHFRGISRHHRSVRSPLYQPLSQPQPNIWFKPSTIPLISFDHHPLPHCTTIRSLPTQLSYMLLLLRVPWRLHHCAQHSWIDRSCLYLHFPVYVCLAFLIDCIVTQAPTFHFHWVFQFPGQMSPMVLT